MVDASLLEDVTLAVGDDDGVADASAVAGAEDSDDDELDEDTSLLVDVVLSVDEDDEPMLEASLVAGEALLSVDDDEGVTEASLLVVGVADSDDDD